MKRRVFPDPVKTKRTLPDICRFHWNKYYSQNRWMSGREVGRERRESAVSAFFYFSAQPA